MSTPDQPQPAPAEAAPAAPPAARAPKALWALLAVMTIFAVGFAVAWAQLYIDERDRERVRDAAEQLVLHLTTFEGETIDEWVQQTQTMATDTYAEEVNTLFDAELRAALRDAKAKSVGRLVNLFVQDVDGGNAMVFAVLRQTITNEATRTPVEDELRMQIQLRSEGGQWKAAKVEVLGSQGGGLGSPAVPGDAEPDSGTPDGDVPDSEREGS